jgi:cytochrome c5
MSKWTTLSMILIILFAAGPAFAASDEAVHSIVLPVVKTDLKDGVGKEKVEALCGICHSLDYIPMQPPLSKAQWTGTVNKMIKVMGAPVSEQDAPVIVEYLTEHYGAGK